MSVGEYAGVTERPECVRSRRFLSGRGNGGMDLFEKVKLSRRTDFYVGLAVVAALCAAAMMLLRYINS